MILYNMNDETSWKNVNDWLTRLREYKPEIPVMIAGNQLDKLSENHEKHQQS